MNNQTTDEYRMTSYELSKKLDKKWFGQENLIEDTEYVWVYEHLTKGKWELIKREEYCTCNPMVPAYDILNDLCVRYAKEMFGEEKMQFGEFDLYMPKYMAVPIIILHLLQQGKKQKAEDYFWEYCLLNPKNKK